MDNGAFFLRGFARSGTNWLCNLVNLHPDVFCRGEFHLEEIAKGVEATKAKPYGLLNQGDILDSHFEAFVDGLIKFHCQGAPKYGDRTPIPIKDCYIPKHKYIVIFRDVRDVLVSLHYHNFLHTELDVHPDVEKKRKLFLSDSTYFETHKSELLDCEEVTRNWAKLWNNHILSDAEFIESKKSEIDIFPVLYEQLHVDTEKIRDDIYRFLGVNPFDAMPLDEKNQPGVKNPDVNAHNRKGETGGWKNYFTPDQLQWVNEETHEGMDWIRQKFEIDLE